MFIKNRKLNLTILDDLNTKIIFVLIVAVVFFAFLAVFPFTLVGGDEGVYLQAAMRLDDGLMPISQYSARAPFLITTIYIFQKLFGPSFFALRFVSMLISALIAGLIFLIGQNLFNRRVGLLAAVLFGLNPFVLWSFPVIKSELFAILFMLISALFLLRGLKGAKYYFFILAGIFIGLGFIERQSALAFGLAAALLIIWRAFQKDNTAALKQILKRGFLLFVGFLIGFFPVFLWIASYDFLQASDVWFGTLLRIAVADPLAPGAAFQYSVFSYDTLRYWAITLTQDLGLQGWILFQGIVFFLLGIVQIFFENRKRARWLISFFIILVFEGALLEHSLALFFTKPNFHPMLFLMLALFSAIMLATLFLYKFFNQDFFRAFLEKRDEVMFVFVWIVSFVLVYSFSVGYLRELFPPFVLASAFVIASFSFKKIRPYVKFLLLVCVVGLWVIGILWFQNPITGGWWWDQKTINLTAQYIKERTAPGEEIFSVSPLPIFLAQRKVLDDIIPSAYVKVSGPDQATRFFPSANKLLDDLSSKKIKYAVLDKRMEKYLFSKFPFFLDYIKLNYALVAEYGSGKAKTQIWQRE